MAAVSDYKKFTAKGGYGEFEEITEEREVLEITAKEEKCIVHFMIPTFERCKVHRDIHPFSLLHFSFFPFTTQLSPLLF